MDVAELSPLVVFALIATVTPGGATTLATASGAHFGFRRSVPLMAGIAVGLASMAAAAAAGLGGVLLAVPWLQVVMKLVGSLYLLWLAVGTARAGAPGSPGAAARPVGFLGGVWMLWQNPKGWTMTLGAAASFAALAAGPAQLAVLMGATFAVAASLSLSLWCLAGLLLARLLRTDRQWGAVNLLLAGLLVASIVLMWI
ncbi:LysE family translocator [Streptomyces sp. NEAU-YJ-81]|uniref:LysE family translocator n=1 Tax=Streptomyces sp. NEAU-YJ-81 TaxID=2820288 RepID=UPI001ABC061B|nr:LysE family transporter [Streptomyces sp. NEAU-YJ-81]MBO3681369.1 LysE family transporter [Streptomyces sp. NEAU-YJ-81]